MAGRDNPRSAKVSGIEPGHVIAFSAMGIFVAVNIAVWIAYRVAIKLGAVGDPSPFPLVAAIEVWVMRKDEMTWTTVSTVTLVFEVVIVLGVIAAIVTMRRRSKKAQGGTSRIDHATRNMASRRDIASMSPKARKKEHLDNNLTDCGWYGGYLGREWDSGQVLMSGTEDHVLNLWAPRQGKTTSKAIPQVWNAPGMVVATSCKRDLIDETIDVRRAIGTVWVFDPQNIAPGITGAGFFFDPLDFVRAERYMDGAALQLTQIFEGATTNRDAVSNDAGENEYFYQQARELLTELFLAAAIGRLPITEVYAWVAQPGAQEPVEILADSPYIAQLQGLNAKYRQADKTRSSIFSAASNLISCLSLLAVRRWVTAGDQPQRLDIESFAHDDSATLYMLSEEDNPVARPISTVLAMLINKALKERASHYDRDRLPVPPLMELDEMANVVRWPNFAEAMSSYGSRGILFDVFLQTYSQGVEMWGETGMRKIYALAAVKVIGPGQGEPEFARMVSEQVGTFREVERSVSHSSGGASSSSSAGSDRPILSVDEIQNLEKRQMIVIATGRRPMLARMIRATEQTFTERTRTILNDLEEGRQSYV